MAKEKVDKDAQKALALVRTRTMERAQGNALPIGYKTLSIHVTETQRTGAKIDAKTKGKKSSEDLLNAETDYFAAIDFHKLTPAEVNLRFNSNEALGLSQVEAGRRLKSNGPNILDTRRPNYFLKLLGYLFGGFCSILWVGSITFFICWQPPLSDPPNDTNLALAILLIFVILIQASFSAFQDFSTSRVMSSILDMIPAECHVFRDGQLVKVPAADLVIGDRVHLSLGNKVPADLRILQTSNDTRFDRSVLTGESEPIEASIFDTDDNFLESKNIAFLGTHLIQGSAVGIVVLKGNDTLMGRINKLTTGRKDKKTIIQREITRFVAIVISLTITLVLFILIVWLAWLRPTYPDFMSTSVLLVTLMGCVIAFIPEGVPICISLTLLMIARRMRNNAILPKTLSTVETLGCVNVVCSDKTGTLTENKMVVANVAFLDHEATPEEVRTKLEKAAKPNTLPQPDDEPSILAMQQLQLAALLCNNAKFDPATIHAPALIDRKLLGDATDCALLRFAHEIANPAPLSGAFERTSDIPFNSRNKWMMTVHQGSKAQPALIKTLFGSDMVSADKTPNEKDSMLVFVKGAPDVLLPYCTSFVAAATNTPQPLSAEWTAELSRIQQTWSRRGQRVLMLCKGRFNPYLAEQNTADSGPSNMRTTNAATDELTRQGLQELCILGLVGIMDPPRPEIKDTIAACRSAGARFFMVTGDYGLTAAAIARQIGLFSTSREADTYENIMDPSVGKSEVVHGSDRSFDDTEHEEGRPLIRMGTSLVLTGSDIAKLSPGEWELVCSYEEIVFARTSPEQKLRIVTELQNRNCIVAVTGDGVNDAPALKAADVGVAVVSGSDVAIEAADLILLGGFDSIPEAIRLGRLVFQNLQKSIGYLLPAGSWSEVWPVLINVLLGTPLTLSSFLMVIICCFTDTFPCTALVMEQEEFNLLSLKPRNTKKEHLISLKIYGQSYFFIGTMMSVFCNMFFFIYMKEYTGLGFKDLVFTFGNDRIAEKLAKIGPMSIDDFNNIHVNTAQCVCFVTLVIVQWGNILSVRNRRLSILQADPIRPQRRNFWLFAGMLASFLVAVLVTETPGIQDLMLTRSVPIKYWLYPIPCALAILFADEVRKLIVRAFPKSIIAKIAW